MVNAGEAAGITISHGVMAIDVTRERVLVSKVSEARWGGGGGRRATMPCDYHPVTPGYGGARDGAGRREHSLSLGLAWRDAK